ncbi:MAG: 23S rRNA pseudouridine(1911/1915/1917) synthase RluD [Xanthomonadaceae bacterium]|jgi:23S rRNA pseudouridine1911/1915/1917 synthase|nr:23S rRNA pseudouridine(1911/1915/1917) synthase RluD [Xanthomonadaceae bacterium]
MNGNLTNPTPTRVERSAQVPLALAGQRLDRVVAEIFPDFSRSRLADWIKAGHLTVDGRPARPRDPMAGGETLSLAVDLERQVEAAGEAIDLVLVHEDKHLFIVDKPPGLVVHPGAGNPAGTLQNALLHRDPKLAEIPRAGIVHRLDKDTSGVMVVARTLAAHTRLVEMIAAREVHRRYEAVVYGAIVAGGTIDAPIGRHRHERTRMAVLEEDESAREAVTHYRVRERYRAHTRVQVDLETGRTHQIRVHFAHIRHPLIGDPVYGGLKLPKGASDDFVAVLRGFRRQALHAERLEFPHPVTGKPIVAEAKRPPDLDALIAALRADLREHPER